MRVALLLGGALAGCTVAPPSLQPIATESGPVAGLVTRLGRTFFAVPYAAPPIGALRWREPQPLAPWTQVLAADRPASTTNPEDCLRLDLFLPPGAPRRAPLVVWLTDGVEAPFDGTALAAAGTAVAVVRARRGALGTFAHPALELQRPGGPVHFALLDQLFALQWLHRHAAVFGFDADNVTLAATGRRAQEALWLLCNGEVRGLVQRAALADVELPHPPAARRDALAAGQHLLAKHELSPATTAVELRALPAERLLALPLGDGPLDGAIADGAVVHGPLSSRWLQDAAPVPLLLGAVVHAGTDEPPTVAAARAIAGAQAGRAPCHLYLFRFAGSEAAASPAALLQVRLDTPIGRALSPAERWMSQLVRDYWTAFVRGQAPRSPSGPQWPPYDPEHEAALVFDDVTALLPRPFAAVAPPAWLPN